MLRPSSVSSNHGFQEIAAVLEKGIYFSFYFLLERESLMLFASSKLFGNMVMDKSNSLGSTASHPLSGESYSQLGGKQIPLLHVK